VIQKLRNVIQTVDKRSIWLKNNYVHQYIISSGRGPMTADAIRVSRILLIILIIICNNIILIDIKKIK